jgi:hypothetical protein
MALNGQCWSRRRRLTLSRLEEDRWTKRLIRVIRGHLPTYTVSQRKRLPYEIANILSAEIRTYSFQTDILIEKAMIPLVVIEVKYRKFTTHDVITYSSKAFKHKELFPHLRYGFVVGEASRIGNRFSRHNSDFDFAIAVENMNAVKDLLHILDDQIHTAEQLYDVFSNKKGIYKYESRIEIA